MIDFLKIIFNEYEFESIPFQVDGNESVLFKSNSGFSNYILVETSNISECSKNELYDLIYNAILDLNKWENKDLKNTMLVIAHLNDEILNDDNSISKVAWGESLIDKHQLVEENKYIFKKHIFSYTNYELKSLTQYYSESNSNDFKSFVNQQVLDTSKFSDFKNDNEYLSWYGLLLKMLIKLPFIKISSKGDFYYDVSTEIEEEIERKGLLQVKKFVMEFSQDADADDFLTLTEDFEDHETN